LVVVVAERSIEIRIKDERKEDNKAGRWII
jgi:hypothetical protein